MIEEEFSLGGSDFNNLQDDFSLGRVDDTDFVLPTNTPKKTFETSSEIMIGQGSEVEKIYNLLKIEDKKDAKQDWKEYFKSNVEIFTVAGKNYYETLNEKEFSEFEKKCEQWIGEAHERWMQIENQSKIENLTYALHSLLSIFRTPASTKDFTKKIKHNLSSHLNVLLAQKINDGVLEVSEILEMQETAIRIHLVPNSDSGKKSVIDWINRHREKEHFTIESFSETFIRLVGNKPEIERLDTDTIRDRLFAEYKPLAQISSKVLDIELKPDSKLREDMSALLRDNNLLVPNIDFFIFDFLEPEIQRKGEFYFSVPLNAEYYYYLKGTATNRYELSVEQWHQITLVRNIRLDSEVTVSFIMGRFKESTVNGIATMLEKNPDFAEGRIIAGDLETYFEHIGRADVSDGIRKLKEKHERGGKRLVDEVVKLLKSEMGSTLGLQNMDEREDVDFNSLIESGTDLHTLVSFIIENRNDETLVDEITDGTSMTEALPDAVKLMLNGLNEFLQMPDMAQYKSTFIKIAGFVLQELSLSSDCITFVFVLDVLVQESIERNILSSESEIVNYEKIKTDMQKQYDEMRCSMNASASNKKNKFKLFQKSR